MPIIYLCIKYFLLIFIVIWALEIHNDSFISHNIKHRQLKIKYNFIELKTQYKIVENIILCFI